MNVMGMYNRLTEPMQKNTRPFAAGRAPVLLHINLEGVVTT